MTALSCPDIGSSVGYTPAPAYLAALCLPQYADIAPAVSGPDAAMRLCADLDNVAIDCHEPDWDGYGAEPISAEAYLGAQRFAKSLPPGTPHPVISADPDGCMTFEWRTSSRKVLWVSVHSDYHIDYAALFGTARSYGSEPFFDKLPPGLYDLIRRLYAV